MQVAGTGVSGVGVGAAASTKLKSPRGLVFLEDGGGLIVADAGNHQLLHVDLIGQTVALIAGNAGGVAGAAQGNSTEASFDEPSDVVLGGGGAWMGNSTEASFDQPSDVVLGGGGAWMVRV
ncbi:hypothetical protein T484DRAFT_1886894, partial [Baffinella frigidus]